MRTMIFTASAKQFMFLLFLALAFSATAQEKGRGLIAHWPFDDGLASSVHDAYYRAVPQDDAGIVIDTAPGAARVGAGALLLEAAADRKAFVNVGHPIAGTQGTKILSFAGWFKLDSEAGLLRNNSAIWASMPVSAMTLHLNREGKRRVLCWEFRMAQERIRGRGPAIKAGVWHHAAVVWDEKSRVARVYLNGKQIAEEPLAQDPSMSATRGLNLGDSKQGSASWNWNGWLDDIAVFDLVLSPRQIKALADGSFAGNPVSAANVLFAVPEPELQKIVPGELPPPPVEAAEDATQGPLIGHVSESEVVLWARVPEAGTYAVTATAGNGQPIRAEAVAGAKNDWCLRWHLRGLQPATRYTCAFAGPPGAASLETLTIQTPPAPATSGKAAIGFGSCDDFADTALWLAIRNSGVEGFVLLGDTPYIDTTEIKWVRWAYRRYASIPGLVKTFQQIPFWGTWDDHDYGANDSYGTLPGKEFSRQGFVEYRPNASFGEDGQGIYTRFRRGPLEVFLLDTRWFSETEPSWADPSKPTLLGSRQWEWLKRGLLTSDAPFKLLACGMIWDQKFADQESDDWGRYPHEREALFRWLGENNISGVALVGGDIHVSRLLKHPAQDSAGYDIPEFVTSPMHTRVLPEFDRPHPALLASSQEPHTFLKVSADSTQSPPVLKAEWIDSNGQVLFDLKTHLDEMRR